MKTEAAQVNGTDMASRIEANAAQQLAKMEAETPGAHYYSRHGAGTTLEQQYVRSTTGVTPDGLTGNPINSSRFTSNQAQLNAAQRAQTIYNHMGQSAFNFNMDYFIDEGFTKGGIDLVQTTNVHAVFTNGELYTVLCQ